MTETTVPATAEADVLMPLTFAERLDQCAGGLGDAGAMFAGVLALVRGLPACPNRYQAERLLDIAADRVSTEQDDLNVLCEMAHDGVQQGAPYA